MTPYLSWWEAAPRRGGLPQHDIKHGEALEHEPVALLGFPAIFEKGPKPNGRNTVIGVAICLSRRRRLPIQGLLRDYVQIWGETECVVAPPNHFSPKRARRRENLKIPSLGTPSVEGDDVCFVLEK